MKYLVDKSLNYGNLIPYPLPGQNNTLNMRKLSGANHLIRQYISCIFQEEFGNLSLPLLTLIFQMETLYRSDSRSFVRFQKQLLNWLKVSFLTGDYSQRDITDPYWSESDSCPILLSKIVNILRNSSLPLELRIMVFRICISILSTYKVIVIPTQPSYDSIISDYTGQPTVELYIKRSLDNLGINVDSVKSLLTERILSSKWHFSSASGPNGNAVWSAHLDALAVSQDETLLRSLKTYCEVTGMDYIINALELSIPDDTMLKAMNVKKVDHSRLHVLFEKGDKARVIAITDYFTQEALSPLHDVIASLNKSIMMDGTFSQDKAFDRVLQLSKNSESKLYSYDLSSATDRLPVAIQKSILSVLLGNDIADAWINLISNRTFTDVAGNNLRYSVGQPMGTKTSFPMLALTHHVIVQASAINAGVSNFEDYSLLGDDIVIANEFVGSAYVDLMNKLGVTISIGKSIIPSIITNSAEFASRLSFNGIEVSPLPVKLLSRIFLDGSLAPDLQNELIKRNLINSNLVWVFFASFLQELDLVGLAKLNGLPESISGLRKSLPSPVAPDLYYKNWKNTYGITESDLNEFFTFVVIQDQLSKMDTLLSSSNNLLSIILNWSKSSGYTPLTVQTNEVTFEQFITDFIIKNESKFFHPVQEIARSEANRIADILSQLIMAQDDMRILLRKGIIDSIRLRIEEQFIRQFSDGTSFTPYFRRLLDKMLRLILKTSSSTSKRVEHTMKIQSIDQVWTLKVGLGQRLIVSPLVSKSTASKSESQIRISNALNGLTLANSLESITPSSRRKVHPGGRLTSS